MCVSFGWRTFCFGEEDSDIKTTPTTINNLRRKEPLMKKIFCILFVVVFIITFVGCTTSTNYTAEPCEHKGEWITSTQPGCESSGKETFTCEICGDIQTRSIEALGHQYTSTTTESTCLIEGSEMFTCSVCGYSIKNALAKKDHSYKFQNDGADVCEFCGNRTYRTVCVSTLTKIYENLKAPETAKINGIYVMETLWENEPNVAVVIDVSAQNSLNAFTRKDFLCLIKDKKMYFDVCENLQRQYTYNQEQADYYSRKSETAYKATDSMDYLMESLDYLGKATEYLDQLTSAETLIYKVKVNSATIDQNEIIEIAKYNSDIFN